MKIVSGTPISANLSLMTISRSSARELQQGIGQVTFPLPRADTSRQRQITAVLRRQQHVGPLRTLNHSGAPLTPSATTADEEGRLISVRELDDDTASAVASMEVTTKLDEATRISKIKIADKNSALEKLGKYFAMFTDKFQGHINMKKKPEEMTDEGLVALITIQKLSGK